MQSGTRVYQARDVMQTAAQISTRYFFYANCILAVLALLVFLRLPQNDREAAGGLRNLWPRESFKGAVCACWTLKAMLLSTMPSFCDTK